MLSLLLSRKYAVIILALIVFLSALLRLWNLTIIPVFADEAIYIRWAQIMRAEETLRFLPLSDGKQPLFMWLAIPILKIVDDPLFAGRLVSVLSGLGVVVGVFVLTYLLFESYFLSILSSFIFSILPFSVFFDRFALVDSLLSFFGIWTIIFFVITTKYLRLDTAMIAGFFLGGALLTKSPGIYFALLSPLILITVAWPRDFGSFIKRLFKLVCLFLSTYAIAFVMQNILRLGPNFHLISIRNRDYVYPISHLITSPLDPLKPFLARNLEYIWIMGTVPLVLMAVVGIFVGIRYYLARLIFLLAIFFLPILVSSEFSKVMTARYIYPSIPYIAIISSLSFLPLKFSNRSDFFLGRVMSFLKAWSYGALVITVFVAFVGMASYQDWLLLTNPEKARLPRSERSGYLEDWTSGYGIKDAADFLREQYLKDSRTKIVVGTEGYFGTLPDGLQMYLNDLAEITVVGVGLPIEKIPSQLLESKKSGNLTYLAVNDSRIKINDNSSRLKLLFSVPKAVRPDGSQERFLFFEVY